MILIITVLVSPLISQSFQIPHGEAIRYKSARGKDGRDIEYSSQSIYRIVKDQRQYFEVKAHSIDRASETIFTLNRLIPLSVKTYIYGSRGELETSTELKSEPQIGENEIAILEMSDLSHVLRAYPFEDPRDMQLVFLGQGGESMGEMSFWILFEKEETLTLDGVNYESYKLELKAQLSGAMKIFSAMIPKTYMWFSKEDSHHMLRMEGSEGPGADKAIVVEMVSYTK